MDQTKQQYLAHLLEEPAHPAQNVAPADAALSSAAPQIDNETYLKIWELEQGHTNTRWTVATFFLSVSFAIFGFSFQAQLAAPLPLIARIFGLLIYWFAYMLFTRFNVYTRLLRTYLCELEATHRTTLDIHTRARQLLRRTSRRHLSATRLLFYFGILYAVGVAALWWLGL